MGHERGREGGGEEREGGGVKEGEGAREGEGAWEGVEGRREGIRQEFGRVPGADAGSG